MGPTRVNSNPILLRQPPKAGSKTREKPKPNGAPLKTDSFEKGGLRERVAGFAKKWLPPVGGLATAAAVLVGGVKLATAISPDFVQKAFTMNLELASMGQGALAGGALGLTLAASLHTLGAPADEACFLIPIGAAFGAGMAAAPGLTLAIGTALLGGSMCYLLGRIGDEGSLKREPRQYQQNQETTPAKPEPTYGTLIRENGEWKIVPEAKSQAKSSQAEKTKP